MYKIKLLILLLSSLLFSCTSVGYKTAQKFSIDYIGGEVDGLIFANYLKGYLNNMQMYDKGSNYKITATINHENNVYITNVNNTSDREKVSSHIKVRIVDFQNKCDIYKYNDDVEQFYVISSSINFTSNNKALEKLKENNAEILVREFVYKLSLLEDLNCIE